jgi:LCP family protein required for cell wall assembly
VTFGFSADGEQAALSPDLDPRRPVGTRGGRISARFDAWSAASLGARVVAALASLAVFVGSGYAWASYRTLVSNVRTINAIAVPPAGHPRIDGTDQNILLVGDDDRTGVTAADLAAMHTGNDGGGVNTDTMMVLHVPANGSKATGISFPRDSWVNIPGFGMNKLNAAYEFGTENGGGAAGGARLLITVIQNMTGLSIDHYVAVSMLGFYRIAEKLGPIRVCLKQASQDSYSGSNLPAGVSTLDAAQALAFVRQRHNLPRGDLDREVRQQYFLSTEFRKIASAGTLLNPFKLQGLLSAVGSSIVKDPGLDLIKFAQQVQNLSAGNVTFATIPITGTPTITVNGSAVSIVAVDTAAMPTFIADVIGRPTAYQVAKSLTPSTVTVDVVNANGSTGVASLNASRLRQLGFKTGTLTAAAPATATTVEYPSGLERQAKTLALHLPGAQVVMSVLVRQVTLVLGTDGMKVPLNATPRATTSPSSSVPATVPSKPAPIATSTAPAATTAYGSAACIN